MPFQNDYRHMLDVLNNRRPARLPIYEHIISAETMERVLGVQFANLIEGDRDDLDEYFSHYCRFFQEMTYDTVSFEAGLVPQLPGYGAIMGGRPGPIQNRADFERYPWDEIPRIYWQVAGPQFEALVRHIPPGMMALGGVGYGVFEVSEDLVGFQYLPFMQADDPELYTELYDRIGSLMEGIWSTFLQRFGGHFVICRMGDDLGFKTSTLVSPRVIREHVFPQYRRILGQIKAAGKPFLWHSCGKIFSVMEDAIAMGINAKHSNEDQIAPYEEWISRYGDRIGLLGGIDVDILCKNSPEAVYEIVLERGQRFRSLAHGYALGSGNSIPEYIPVDNYLAMLRAAQKIRDLEIQA